MLLTGSRQRPFWRLSLGLLLSGALTLAATPVAAAVPLISAKPDRTVGFDGLVYASAQVGTTVYLGGNFTHAIVDGKPVARKRLAAVDTRTGQLLPWAPRSDGTVLAVTVAGSTLYVTGTFTTIAGLPRAGLAGINLSTGNVGPLQHTITGTPRALAATAGRLFVGGDFTKVDGRAAPNLAAFRLSDGAVDTGFRGSANKKVQVLYAAGPRLYVGGYFTSLNNVTGTGRLAALRPADGQVDPQFRSATPYPVYALTATADRLFAALAGPGGRVVAYQPNGTLMWSSVTDGDVQAITYLNGAIYAGGHFTVVCPTPFASATAWCKVTKLDHPKLAAWDPATGAVLAWNPQSNGKWGVLTLGADPVRRTITVGGDFTAFGTAARLRFAKFGACAYGCGQPGR
ncbi:delta-60 repeat domain-containing protein [Actinoplanes sp. KI2]|uniref:delta-60 repeat domain-containing protein n=1 Tax=Actinoplanes sp. KI2 TaxID=2983315 RepID=UPI0021D5967A|nr:delta-60 repeat domain-containing protein [Actinoplanes sp. KI2]MCU7728919.1 delta-60 repeat domain-containing protein [Actinoplanes sp. KI2]